MKFNKRSLYPFMPNKKKKRGMFIWLRVGFGEMIMM